MPLLPIVVVLQPEDRDAFRHRLADAVEELIALLDALDGDPNLEPYLAANGWLITDDREGDYSDFEPEEENDDGDSGIADLDARGDPELCWTAKRLYFDGAGVTIARVLLASIKSNQNEARRAADGLLTAAQGIASDR